MRGELVLRDVGSLDIIFWVFKLEDEKKKCKIGVRWLAQMAS
jgi:hypothetical protein